MFCPHCGATLKENSKFCSSCGMAVNEAAQPAENVIPPQPPVDPIPPQPPVDPISPVAPVVQAAPKKKLKLKSILILAGVLVAVAAVVLLVLKLASGSSGDHAYVVLSSRNKYLLLRDLEDEEPVEIASLKTSSMDNNLLIRFSPDGKYLYYFTKIDYENYTGTLNRAEYGKFRQDSSQNAEYSQVIATNTGLNMQITEKGRLFYLNGSNSLFYCDGTESTQIAKNVFSYYLDGEDTVLYLNGEGENKTLFGVSLKEPDKKVKLASNVYSVIQVNGSDVIYSKEDEDWRQSLYTVGFNKENQLLGESTDILFRNNDEIVFAAKTGTTPLYDYVIDEKAAADEGIKEPNQDDFSVPVYSFDMVSGYDLKESDYTDLYTSCTNDLYWYGESYWWCSDMNDALKENYGDHTEAIHSATQSFIDKFASKADENGYIAVTAEVKSALQEINRVAEKEDWKWLWLCFSRNQTGTRTNWDEYYAAYDVYSEASNRIRLRELLKDESNASNLYTIYRYRDGKAEPLCENVVAYSHTQNGVLYRTADTVTEKLPLDEISGLYDVRDLLKVDFEGDNNAILSGIEKPVKITASVMEQMNAAENYGYVRLYPAKNVVYLSQQNGEVSFAKIENDTMGDFSLITDDAEVMLVKDGILYFRSDKYTNGGTDYWSLYSYQDGKTTKLAEDLRYGYAQFYEDGRIFGNTGESGSRAYELTAFDKDGKATHIADDVQSFIRIDKDKLLYISDNTLYLYDWEKSAQVCDDVKRVWCTNPLTPEFSIGSVNES